MPVSMDDDNGRRRHWHLEKSISVSHIISTLIIAVTAMSFITDIKTDIVVLKRGEVVQARIDDRQDKELARVREETRESFSTINGKLDRLLEKEYGRR